MIFFTLVFAEGAFFPPELVLPPLVQLSKVEEGDVPGCGGVWPVGSSLGAAVCAAAARDGLGLRCQARGWKPVLAPLHLSASAPRFVPRADVCQSTWM